MTEQPPLCPFCSVGAERIAVQNDLALALHDAFPLTQGHTLVVPRRHVADYFDLSPREQAAIWELVNRVRELLAMESQPDGYNLGVNVGLAAGQTVGHAHVHVIPRCHGDTDDPRGGVRWIFPKLARYWEERSPGDQQTPGNEG